MKTLALICFCSLIGLWVATVRAADLAGQWRAEFDTQIGVQKYRFAFQTNDDQLTGQAVVEAGGQRREVKFTEVKMDGASAVVASAVNSVLTGQSSDSSRTWRTEAGRSAAKTCTVVYPWLTA